MTPARIARHPIISPMCWALPFAGAAQFEQMGERMLSVGFPQLTHTMRGPFIVRPHRQDQPRPTADTPHAIGALCPRHKQLMLPAILAKPSDRFAPQEARVQAACPERMRRHHGMTNCSFNSKPPFSLFPRVRSRFRNVKDSILCHKSVRSSGDSIPAADDSNAALRMVRLTQTSVAGAAHLRFGGRQCRNFFVLFRCRRTGVLDLRMQLPLCQIP